MAVIFLAFAHSQEHPLSSLSREYDQVYKTLSAVNKGLFIVDGLEYSTRERINDRLGNYANNLAIFHFSGHAGEDSLLLDDVEANADGIAHQLRLAAQNGRLKLVVLNGCSTAGQVESLQKLGVPAIVATNAPVGDISACEFSIRFYANMCIKRMNIKDAFTDALGPAATINNQVGDPAKPARGLGYLNGIQKQTPLWELFYNKEEDIEINPVPLIPPPVPDYVPNVELTKAIFETLYQAGNAEMAELWNKMQKSIVTPAKIQKAFLEILPFPVTAHLQKLLSSDQGDKGYDRFGFNRLKQIGTVYQMVMEFLGYIMISQFWELQILKINGNVTDGSNGNGRLPGDPGAAASDQVKEDLSVPVKETLKKYFYLNPTERSSFDYLPFFRDIRAYFDTLNDGKGVKFFVEELEILKELSEEGQSFEQACKFLTHLHKQTMVEYLIPDNEVDHLCMVGENMLCRFFEKLGFLHRYTLTSVQKINIQKYRHNTTANFKHQVVKLMDAFGTPELNYYQMSKYLDNTGVILTKQNLELLDASRRLWVFPKGELAFLNLSAFVIDRNSFEDRADISNLMFFQQVREEGKVYTFKDVRRPDSERDCFEVPATERFEAVHLQFAAFTEMLNETT